MQRSQFKWSSVINQASCNAILTTLISWMLLIKPRLVTRSPVLKKFWSREANSIMTVFTLKHINLVPTTNTSISISALQAQLSRSSVAKDLISISATIFSLLFARTCLKSQLSTQQLSKILPIWVLSTWDQMENGYPTMITTPMAKLYKEI